MPGQLWRWVRQPLGELRRMEAQAASIGRLPYGNWAALVAIAVGGSALYGASPSLVLPRWRPQRRALWLARSAGPDRKSVV